MSRTIESMKPSSQSLFWRAGWHAHMMGGNRVVGASIHGGRNLTEWRAGWDARHRLSVIAASGCGRIVG